MEIILTFLIGLACLAGAIAIIIVIAYLFFVLCILAYVTKIAMNLPSLDKD